MAHATLFYDPAEGAELICNCFFGRGYYAAADITEEEDFCAVLLIHFSCANRVNEREN